MTHGPSDPGFAAQLVQSYARLTGEALVPRDVSVESQASWLYGSAPFVLLAHDTAADPRFIYANRTAQRVFGYGWDEFVRLPSRLSAEAPNRADRQRLFDAVARAGFQRGYRGKRIAKCGRSFWIEDGVIWQVRDGNGILHCEAAMVPRWADVEPVA